MRTEVNNVQYYMRALIVMVLSIVALLLAIIGWAANTKELSLVGVVVAVIAVATAVLR